MIRRWFRAYLSLVYAAAWLITVAGGAAGAESSIPAWSAFTMQATRFGSTATAVVERQRVAAAAATPAFIDSPRGRPLEATHAEVQRLSITVTLEITAGRRVQLENHLWSDPHTNTPLYLVRTRFGLKDYHQQFRFTREGVFRRQREPSSAREAGKPPESWTKRGEHFYPYSRESAGCPPIIESSQLIHLAEELWADPSAPPGPLCVFHKRQVHRVSVQPQPPQPIRFDYLERGTDGEQRRAGTVSVPGMRLASQPIGSYRGNVEDFVRDGTFFYLSPEGRWPLVAVGEMPLFGRVEMRLKEITFR